jgi:hypothetical protein
MLLILSILLGIALGQFIKVDVSPELMDFIKSSWALVSEKVPPVATLAAEKVKTLSSKAVKFPRIAETV